jgi:hypothetical protein
VDTRIRPRTESLRSKYVSGHTMALLMGSVSHGENWAASSTAMSHRLRVAGSRQKGSCLKQCIVRT